MAKDMLGTAVRKLVTLPDQVPGIVCDLLEKLADQEWVDALKKFLRKENPWPSQPQIVLERILEQVGTFTVPPLPPFSPSRIAVGEVDGVPIGYLEDNLSRILAGFGSGQEPAIAEATTLYTRVLLKPSLDSPIIAELGGEEAARTTFGLMLAFLKSRGRPNMSVWFIFYIPDARGKLWAVNCGWHSGYGYWRIGADPVTYPYTWDADNQVVSR